MLRLGRAGEGEAVTRVRNESAGVRKDDLQIGVPAHDAIEHELARRSRGIEQKVGDVGRYAGDARTLQFGGMHEYHGPPAFQLGEERLVRGFTEVPAVGIGQQHHARGAQLVVRVRELRERTVQVGQRQRREESEAIGVVARDLRGEQVVREDVSLQMRDLLRYVVTNGSGRRADVPGYDVGGKTGSAQVPGPHGRYIPHALRTSFYGVFPVHDPRYVVFILLDQPHGTKATGGFALAGWTAAPAVGRVIQRIAPLLGVPAIPVATKLAGGPA